MSKYLDLAKKIKALADRGIGGEKVNAQLLLDKIMKEHNITIEQLEGVVIGNYYIKVKVEDRQLFSQIVATILGSESGVWQTRYKPKYRMVKTTSYNAIQINAKFKFYLLAFNNELKAFKSAFIMANNLYPEDGAIQDEDNLTEEEKEASFKAFKMSEGMTKHVFLKQLKR